MLNLVWPPLSRLGGVLWGRLRPPSLPSPLPCPGRGMSGLEGLSTEVPSPPPVQTQTLGDGENCPPASPSQSLLSWPVSFVNCFIYWASPAFLHAQQCLCFSCLDGSRAALAQRTQKKWWWLFLWMMRRRSPKMDDIWLITECWLILAGCEVHPKFTSGLHRY